MNISVIIPVYNAEKYIEKAVESALQFHEVKEILLIEDASTDHSLEVCKNLTEKHSRVQLHQHYDKGNHGAGASRNLGLDKVSQDYIAFLDADDYYLPNRFDAEKELFKNPKIEGVFGAIGTEFLTEVGKKKYQEKFKNTKLTTVNYEADGEQVFYGLLGLDNKFGTFFHLNALTIRKKKLKQIGLSFNTDLRLHQDSDFIVKIAYHLYLSTGNISEAVAIRGVHDHNRITQIIKFSKEYNQNQYKLWNSIYFWSMDKTIPKKLKEHIQNNKNSFELATTIYTTKIEFYKDLFAKIIQSPNILKIKYRYHFQNKL